MNQTSWDELEKLATWRAEREDILTLRIRNKKFENLKRKQKPQTSQQQSIEKTTVYNLPDLSFRINTKQNSCRKYHLRV